MTLLFITQKLHGQDAFGALWIRAFQRRGYDVEIICLEARPDLIAQTLGSDDLPPLRIHSMGKETGNGKVAQIFRFWKLISTLKYDRVFIHMTPVWGLLGAWLWIARRTPVYLWYTHYKMQWGLRLLHIYGKRMFCATPQSMPQYEGSPKKIVTGHGIDLAYWPQRANSATDPHKLLGVYRLSRSKRIEIIIRALALLPPEYTFDIYGISAEQTYVDELKTLVSELKLEDRVTFRGTAVSKDLPQIYTSHRLILNMASETIDKTMLEAMTCGCYPMTTLSNARAIGIPEAPAEDSPESVAAFVERWKEMLPIGPDEMYATVKERHSLDALIAKMDVYIHPGT